MLSNQRILIERSGTVTDSSVDLNEYLSGSVTLSIEADDSIYLGSDLPFNHRWFEITTANSSASAVSVYLWSGTQWNQAVDVIDQTSVTGKTLAQSGIISWVPDRQKTWSSQDSTESMDDLSDFKIYDMYWVKITFSGDLHASSSLLHVGHKFSSDAQLEAQYPELAQSTLKAAFKTGKTTWNDQTFEAAGYIIQDIKSMRIARSENQILDWQVFKNASVHKTAEIIFRAFGDDYEDNLVSAMKAYSKAMDIKFFNIDQNSDARLEPVERQVSTGWMSR